MTTRRSPPWSRPHAGRRSSGSCPTRPPTSRGRWACRGPPTARASTVAARRPRPRRRHARRQPARSLGTPPDRLSRFTRSVRGRGGGRRARVVRGSAHDGVVAVGQFLRGSISCRGAIPATAAPRCRSYARRPRANGSGDAPPARRRDHVPHPEHPQRTAARRGRAVGTTGGPSRSTADRGQRPSGRRLGPAEAYRLACLTRHFALGPSANPAEGRAVPSPVPCCTRRSRSAKRKPPPSGRISRTSTVPCSRLTNLPEVVKGALFAARTRAPTRVCAACSSTSSSTTSISPATSRSMQRSGCKRAEELYDARLLRIRRRLRRPTRRRAPRVRASIEPADEGARVGPAHGLPRAVDSLHPVRLALARPLPLPAPVRGAASRSSACGTSADMDALFDTYSATAARR